MCATLRLLPVLQSRFITHNFRLSALSSQTQIWEYTWMAHYTILLVSCQRQLHITLSFLCHIHVHLFIFVSFFLSHRDSWSMCLSDTLPNTIFLFVCGVRWPLFLCVLRELSVKLLSFLKTLGGLFPLKNEGWSVVRVGFKLSGHSHFKRLAVSYLCWIQKHWSRPVSDWPCDYHQWLNWDKYGSKD